VSERMRLSHAKVEEEAEVPEMEAPHDDPILPREMSALQAMRQHFMDIRTLCLGMPNSVALGEILNRVYESEGFITQLEKEDLEDAST
jgi:hypothetical protein